MIRCHNLRTDKEGNYYCGTTHVCYKHYCADFGIFGKIRLTPKKVLYIK